MNSPIVTLTTDWGLNDFFVGKFKGRLYSMLPDVRIVDISHEIPPFDLKAAYFVVKNACLEYPEGTIHIIDVNSSDTQDSPSVVVKYKGQFFICTDNGLPMALFGGQEKEMVVIDRVFWDSNFFTFTAYDYFCKVAAMIVKGATMQEVGYAVEESEMKQMFVWSTNVKDDGLTAYVAYIDNYGNVDLNLSYEEFEMYRKGRPFEMSVHDAKLTEVSKGYEKRDASSRRLDKLTLTVSSAGCLQLAIYGQSTEQLFGLKINENIEIKFLS